MKYIFFGSPDFAAAILERLLKTGLVPLAVVTNADRPRGRKQLLTPPPVKFLISNFLSRKVVPRSPRDFSGFPIKVDILQPETLDEQFIEKLKSYRAEVFILAAYGKILPKEMMAVPPRGIVGVHPSLLPKYRGATPLQSALLAGEQRTGTTLFLLDEKVDHGEIISNYQLPISNNDNYETLLRKLAEASAELLIKTLPKYLTGELKPRPQKEGLATYTKKFSSEDAYVDPAELAQASHGASPEKAEIIWRKVRALNPEPGVYTFRDGRRLKILEADFRAGKLILKKIQAAGEQPKSI